MLLPRIGSPEVADPKKICSTILGSGQLSEGQFGHLEGYREGYKLNKQCVLTLVSSRRSN
jgi:hypothetical protein